MKQVVRPLAAAILLGLMAAGNPAGAQDSAVSDRFDSADEEAIRKIVRDYLLEHPEVLIEALNAYEEQRKVAEQERQKELIVTYREQLRTDATSPVLGNPDGDVVVVEFFDYNCPYCKTVARNLMDTVNDDGNIRLVMKEFPILGPGSVVAARAALAAEKQDLYEDFHFELMKVSGKLNEDLVMRIADDVGLDVDQLKEDMEDPEIDRVLRRNTALARRLGIGGTPAFIIGDQLVPGAIQMNAFKQLVEQTRSGAS